MFQGMPRSVPYHKLKEYALKALVEILHKNPGESIFSEEWEHLIIIDDCRFDTFEREFRRRQLPGKLLPKPSLGSWTGEFLIKNFPEERYEDIVFVTANPFVDKYLKGKFHAMVSVWKTGWNERYQTVPPGEVYRATVKAMERYPNKRLVVHFLQPHHPYFSLNFSDRTMKIIRDSIKEGSLRMDTVANEPINELYLSPIYGKFHVRKLMWAYRENLRIVIPYVEMLLHRLRGKTIVTADHGELFGEPVTRLLPIRVYGHGIGRNPNLIRVPWWVIEDVDRERLRPVKEIRKKIALIEGRFGLRRKRDEGLRLKKAISRLKLKGRI